MSSMFKLALQSDYPGYIINVKIKIIFNKTKPELKECPLQPIFQHTAKIIYLTGV